MKIKQLATAALVALALGGGMAFESNKVQAQGVGLKRLLSEETSREVVSRRRQNMNGGYSTAEATLYRRGRLIIEGEAIATERTQGTRSTVNVIGIDRTGQILFVSQPLNIPTACGKWDPACSSRRSGRNEQNISPEIAKYVNRLHIVFSERQGPTVVQRTTQAIRQACTTYDNLPTIARAAIAAETGFPGCNPFGR